MTEEAEPEAWKDPKNYMWVLQNGELITRGTKSGAKAQSLGMSREHAEELMAHINEQTKRSVMISKRHSMLTMGDEGEVYYEIQIPPSSPRLHEFHSVYQTHREGRGVDNRVLFLESFGSGGAMDVRYPNGEKINYSTIDWQAVDAEERQRRINRDNKPPTR